MEKTNMDIFNPDELKLLILNSNEPLLFKQVLTPEILKWSMEDWESKLKDEILEFRLGKFEYTSEPQWERRSEVIKSSFNYFLQHSKFKVQSEENKWLYFDYKYLDKWFTNIEELRSISWAPLGFPNITTNDCTMWMGTKGAHTPCHVDTYGFNLIFQVYGRKLWIVAPPEENLLPTRIPYEESSIYSKLNFFSPNAKDFKGVHNCRKIILNPGEVLYLPHKWWHYVENLDTAISVNVWVPMPEDDEERLAESIVQFFVKQIVDISNEETSEHILNPNMQEPILNENVGNMLELINNCKTICRNKVQNNKKIKKANMESTASCCEVENSKFFTKHSCVEKIPKMSQDEFNNFLAEQSSRFKNTQINEDANIEKNDILELLDVFTDAEVVTLISEKLLKKIVK